MPKAIYHFILDHRIGGPQIYVKNIQLALKDRKHFIVTPAKGEMTDIALLNLRKKHKFLFPFEVILNALKCTFLFLFNRNCIVFHIHGAANIAPSIAAFLLRIPVLWHIHETLIQHKILSRITRFFVLNNKHLIATVAEKSKDVYNLDYAEIVPGAIDLSFWNDKEIKEQKRLKDNTLSPSLSIVTVGHLNPLKGIEHLLTALYEIDLPISVKIVGAELNTQKTYADSLKSIANDLIKNKHNIKVEFVGSQPPVYIRTLFSNSDIFVLPSISEACPLSLIEAMSMSLPVIATDVGDVLKMLPETQKKYVCPAGDPISLAESILSFAKMPKVRRDEIGRINREFVEAHFSISRLGSQVRDLYSRLVV